MGKKTWTEEEDKILIENYYNYSDTELHQLFLPNKSPKAIERKIFRLNLGEKSPDVKQRGIEKWQIPKKNTIKHMTELIKVRFFQKKHARK